MDTAISVGNKITVDSFEGISQSVVDVLAAVHDYRITEAVALKALDVIALTSGAPNNTTISGATFYGDTTRQAPGDYIGCCYSGDDGDDE